MHKEKITILFVISANKTNQKGLWPLNCRITFNRERKQLITGFFVNPLNWQNKLQKIAELDSNSKLIDSKIDEITNKINKISLVFELQAEYYSLEDIYNKYISKDTLLKSHLN